MSSQSDEIWSFVAEYYDPLPQITKQYLLKYFPKQNQVEMVDMKNKRLFLKKTPCPPSIDSNDFFFGAQIVLFSRDLKIVDYADTYTRSHFSNRVEDGIIFLLPSSTSKWGKLIGRIVEAGHVVSQLKSIEWGQEMRDKLVNVVGGEIDEPIRNDGPLLAVKAQSTDATTGLSELAKSLSIEFNFPLIAGRNQTEVSTLSSWAFDPHQLTTATFDHCTCCIVKPHAIKSNQLGSILDDILSAGYEVSAVASIHFSKAQAEEFLAVYKSVASNFSDHVLQLTSGISVALELRAENAVNTFRQTAGPWDVEFAKALRPQSLRAKYGLDSVRCAVHCTDLEEDGVLECEYCFKILT